MAKQKSGEIIVGLDIGTTKICAIVGEVTDERHRHHRHRHAPVEGAAQGRGRQHRGDRGLHPPRHRGGRADGRLRDHPRLHRHRRRPHQGLQQPGHRRGEGQGGPRGGHRARHRRGQGGGHPAGPRGHPRPAAGVHHRRPGRHQGAAGHGRRAPRGQGPHRHRRGRPARRTSSSAPTARGLNVADIVLQPLASRRGGARATTRRSWACASSTSAAAPPTSPSSPAAPSCTPRSSRWAATTSPTTSPSACARRRTRPSGSSRSTAARSRRMVDKDETIEVPERGRPPAARARPADPLRDPRAARGGDLPARAPRDPEVRLRGPARLRRGHHRRLDAARRACRSWPRRSSACRCAAGMPRGIGGLVDVVKSPMYATAWAWSSTARSTRTGACSASARRTLQEGEGPHARVAGGDLLVHAAERTLPGRCQTPRRVGPSIAGALAGLGGGSANAGSQAANGRIAYVSDGACRFDPALKNEDVFSMAPDGTRQGEPQPERQSRRSPGLVARRDEARVHAALERAAARTSSS